MSTGYRLLALLLAALALAAASYQFGRHVRAGEYAQQQLDDGLAYAGAVREAQDQRDQLAADLSAARTKTTNTNRTITREVIRYVEVTPPALRVYLPDPWRVRHNLAATGAAPPDPAPGPLAAGTAGPVEDAAALDAIADNYATCRDSADKLAGWRAYWRTIEPLSQAKTSQP